MNDDAICWDPVEVADHQVVNPLAQQLYLQCNRFVAAGFIAPWAQSRRLVNKVESAGCGSNWHLCIRPLGATAMPLVGMLHVVLLDLPSSLVQETCIRG